MQYARLMRLMAEAGRDNEGNVTIPASVFQALLGSALRGRGMFDEKYYLGANPDVAEAVEQNTVRGASDHYFATGYFEGRMPKRILVDERYYLENNPDVAEAMRQGSVESAQQHFEVAGYGEGRLPHKGFSLF